MDQNRHFKTLDEFNRGYAGPQTLLLEKKSRELAGRQDNFCLICGDDKAELFPQLGPKEIHLCPRKFCNKCYYIESGWKERSKRFNNKIYQESEFVPLCCTLCWKRGWDISNPLLGQDQPEWQTWTGEPMEDVLNHRYKHWEECAVDKECAGLFKWRLPLRYLPDDMTLESDRELLKAIKNDFLKKSTRFDKFENTAILEASPPSGPTFDVRRAFDGIARRLLKISRSDGTCTAEKQRVAGEEELGEPEGVEGLEELGDEEEHEATEEEREATEEEHEATEEEHEAAEQVQQGALQRISNRPQRQAAQFNFVKVKGVPVRQQRSTTQNNVMSGSPDVAQDILDQQTSNSMGIKPSTPQMRGFLHTPTSNQHISRPRGRPRKVLTDPTSLPPSPSTQEDDATPGPSFMHNQMTVDEDSNYDDSYDKIKVIIDDKNNQIEKVKEAKAQQEAQLRLLNGKLERSQARAEMLVQECEALSTTESELRHQISAVKVTNASLELSIVVLKQEHESQLQTIAELNRRIAQQAEQKTADIQNLHEEIEDHKRKHASLEADLEASKTKEAELSASINDQREAYNEQQGKFDRLKEENAKLEKENGVLLEGIGWRNQMLKDLKNTSGTVDRKSRAIRGLREDQDEVMEANKQLRKDVANLGAELAIDRGLVEADGARLQQQLARGSLTSDLVDRLVQNVFLEKQMEEKIRERAILGQSPSDSRHPQTNGAKKRRINPIADVTEPSWPRGNTELYD